MGNATKSFVNLMLGIKDQANEKDHSCGCGGNGCGCRSNQNDESSCGCGGKKECDCK